MSFTYLLLLKKEFLCIFIDYLQMIWTALEKCVGDISYLDLLLRIRSDHNEDDSARMLREWVDANKNVYHNIDLVIEDNKDSKWCCFHFILYSNRCIMQQVWSLSKWVSILPSWLQEWYRVTKILIDGV